MVNDPNRDVYSSQNVVRHYAQLKLLQPAEQAVLTRLNPQLAQMKMLDIGVGGGRTTHHFHQRVGDYVGIDYAAEMIAACRQRFADGSPPLALEVGDARDMGDFPDQSFDLILFSFNGIDYISHADRLRVLKEIHRVGKPGGYFCFSSHNLQGIERAFDWRSQLQLNPLQTYVDLIMCGLLRYFNRGLDPVALKNRYPCHPQGRIPSLSPPDLLHPSPGPD